MPGVLGLTRAMAHQAAYDNAGGTVTLTITFDIGMPACFAVASMMRMFA